MELAAAIETVRSVGTDQTACLVDEMYSWGLEGDTEADANPPGSR